jgi:hypothetical protein
MVAVSGRIPMSDPSDLDADSRFGAAPSVYARSFGDELVLLAFGRGEYYGLDAIGARIWSLLGDGKSLGEIAAVLSSTYEVTRDDALRDVMTLVAELRGQGLVESR